MSLKTKTQNSHDHQNRSELVGFGSYLCFSAKMLLERDFDLIGMKVDLVAKEKNDAGFVENLSESGDLFVRSSDAHALASLNELRVSLLLPLPLPLPLPLILALILGCRLWVEGERRFGLLS